MEYDSFHMQNIMEGEELFKLNKNVGRGQIGMKKSRINGRGF